ncbi:phage tail tube protein [Brevundimonas sp.]|uniref:phage tail tube protein n=1 Tax=Brevundimonas sp. TaxID=1871086 RepID=UPI003F72072D
MSKLLGRALIKSNGNTLQTLPGAKLDPGGTVRTTVVGAHDVLGYTEAPRQSKLECEIAYTARTSLKQIMDWNDVTIEFQCDTGQTYVISHGWSTEPPTITDNEGKAPVVIEGRAAEEMMS